MSTDKEIVKRAVRRVIAGNLARKDAAAMLDVSLRTVHNYVRRFLDYGPEGLIDRRHGHFRKIEPEQQLRIIACKLDSPHRSARWIRDRLKLSVSSESVRQVLLKHNLSRGRLQPQSRPSNKAIRWDPF